MRYDTGLRAYTSKRIEEIQSADILVGIPCYNNETTIAHVIQMVSHGLATHYKGHAQRDFRGGRGVHGRHAGSGQGI